MRVHGVGPAPARLMVVGEAPGWQEDRAGRPFVGKTGAELDRYFDGETLPHRRHVFLTNIYREFGGKDYEYGAADLTRDEPDLLRELDRVQPQIVVPLGRHATRYFLHPNDTDMEAVHSIPWEGRICGGCRKPFAPSGNGTSDTCPSCDATDAHRSIVVFPLYHPAAGMHNSDMAVYVVSGFHALGQYLAGETLQPRRLYDDPYPTPDYQELTTAAQVERAMQGWTSGSPLVALDTEGYPRAPWSVQFSGEPGRAYLIRAVGREALDTFGRILHHRQMRLLFHSALHDRPMMRALGCSVDGLPFLDTMVAAYLLQIEPLGLKAGCLRHCNMQMSSYLDLMGDKQNEFARDYLTWQWDICSQEYEEQCQAEFDWQVAAGRRLRTLPKLPRSTFFKAVQRVLGSSRPSGLWLDQDEAIVAEGITRLGFMPEATLDHVEPAQAVHYGCLTGQSLVQTEHGLAAIGELVKIRSRVRVWSLDTATGASLLKPITGWYRYTEPARIPWLSVRTEFSRSSRWGDGTRYTPDHRLWTERGWVRIDQLTPDDRIAMPVTALTPLQRQVVVGSVLGDGTVGRRDDRGWAQFRFSNNARQVDYVHWKRGLCGDLVRSPVTATTLKLRRMPSGGVSTAQPQHGVCSYSHPQLIDFARRRPGHGKALGPWIEELDRLGMAIWYQDDGTLVNGWQPRFYTLGFSRDEVDILREVLARKFDIVSDRYAGGSRQWFISLPRISSNTFFALVAAHIHPCMDYKLPEKWRGKFDATLSDTATGRPVFARVRSVTPNPTSKRGNLKTCYCIDVAGTCNFFTQSEIAHNCRDADGTVRYHRQLAPRLHAMGLEEVEQLELGTYPLIDRMATVGLKPNLQQFAVLGEALGWEVDRLRAELRTLTGEPTFNANSGDHVAAYLYDRLGLEPLKMTKSRERGSTNDKILEALERANPGLPQISKIREFRETYKLKYTFVDTIPAHLEKWPYDGRIHATFRTTRVVTGRLAASDPNLLAQPEHGQYAKEFKRGWIAEEGHFLYQADESQVELRVLAHLSQDPVLLSVYRGERRNPDGSLVDLHSALAERIFGIPPHLQDKSKHRLPAKAVNFGISMGMTNRGLTLELRKNGIDIFEDDAQRWLDDTLDLYAGVKTYMARMITQAEHQGYIRCLSGRIRYIGGIHSPDERVREEAERFSFSTPIQEGAQWLMKRCEAKIWQEVLPVFWRRHQWVEPILQIHDCLKFEAEVGLEHDLHVAMTQTMTETPTGFSVPLAVEDEHGVNMADMTKF